MHYGLEMLRAHEKEYENNIIIIEICYILQS